jgi:hypothetical protein
VEDLELSTTNELKVYTPDRPGCVTAYAILLWLGSALWALAAFSIMSNPIVYKLS